jgi:hypothetical protein
MTYNFPECIKDDTFNGVSFTLSINGIAKDLTGATINLIIASKIIFSTTNGDIIISDPLNGKFQLEPRIITLPIGNNLYKIRIMFKNCDVKTYIKGNWKIIE